MPPPSPSYHHVTRTITTMRLCHHHHPTTIPPCQWQQWHGVTICANGMITLTAQCHHSCHPNDDDDDTVPPPPPMACHWNDNINININRGQPQCWHINGTMCVLPLGSWCMMTAMSSRWNKSAWRSPDIVALLFFFLFLQVSKLVLWVWIWWPAWNCFHAWQRIYWLMQEVVFFCSLWSNCLDTLELDNPQYKLPTSNLLGFSIYWTWRYFLNLPYYTLITPNLHLANYFPFLNKLLTI